MGYVVDCVFRVNERRCSALTKKLCGGCRFYKNAKELKESREKAEERMKSLPGRVQREIHDKYYIGRDMEDE